MSKKKKSSRDTNPEFLYEQEKIKAQRFFDDDSYEMCLFPDAFPGSTVSSTESTGLIQTMPVPPELLKNYDELYSYRQSEPIIKEK